MIIRTDTVNTQMSHRLKSQSRNFSANERYRFMIIIQEGLGILCDEEPCGTGKVEKLDLGTLVNQHHLETRDISRTEGTWSTD